MAHVLHMAKQSTMMLQSGRFNNLSYCITLLPIARQQIEKRDFCGKQRHCVEKIAPALSGDQSRGEAYYEGVTRYSHLAACCIVRIWIQNGNGRRDRVGDYRYAINGIRDHVKELGSDKVANAKEAIDVPNCEFQKHMIRNPFDPRLIFASHNSAMFVKDECNLWKEQAL